MSEAWAVRDRRCRVCGHLAGALEETCSLCLEPIPRAMADQDGRRLSVERAPAVAASPGAALRRPVRAASAAAAPEIAGTVLQIHGPSTMEGRRDWWRLGATLLLALSLMPFFLGLWIFLTSVRIALAIAGLRFGGGRGLFGEILTFHILGNALRRPEALPVYDYVVDTGAELVAARQEGEFQEGRIFVGNRVQLRGRRRNGALVIEEGSNESLSTSLTFRPSPWRPAFVLLLGLVAALGFALLRLAEQGALVR